MANSGVNLPSGYGGLMRFNEEYDSKIKLKPVHVIIFVVLIMLFVIGMNLLFPVKLAAASFLGLL